MRLFFQLTRMIFRMLAVFGAVALVLALLLLDFMHRSTVENAHEDLPRTAIVFTGQYDRIHLGIDLLSEDRVDRLFITGVNGGAGLDVAGFPDQFELSPEQIAWLETGKIILTEDASTTFENALEAGCWLDRQPDVDAVVLITSRRHMARASVALQNEIWPIDVIRVFSDPSEDHNPLLLDLNAFGEFAATWGITLLPHDFWPTNTPSICHDEGPTKGNQEFSGSS